MLINLTLIYLTSSNFSPSPLISGQIPNLIIQNSYFSKSFSHFAHLSKINQFRAYSSHFSFFLNTPFIISNNNINGIFLTCNSTKSLKIDEACSFIYVNLCNFENDHSFISAQLIDLISISKSIFQKSNQANNEQACGFQIDNCKELYISKTAFLNCNYSKNSLFESKILQNFTFQNCEVVNCFCKYIFNFPERISVFNINFNNFIDIHQCIFSKSNPITISYCYFKNVEYIMECTNTPMGCLSSVKIIDCSCEGQLPKGYTGSFNNDNNPTTIYIDKLKTSDCDFQSSREPSTPSKASQTISNSQSTESLNIESSNTESLNTKSSTTSSKENTATWSVSQSKSSELSIATPSSLQTQTSSLPTASPEPTKAKFPVIYIILIIVIIIVVIIIIILIICCVRKCLDMKQENLLDRGLMLRYDTDENSETTSDRSNALNIQSDSIESDDNSNDDDNEGDFFSNKLRNRNKFINQNNEENDNSSSSSL